LKKRRTDTGAAREVTEAGGSVEAQTIGHQIVEYTMQKRFLLLTHNTFPDVVDDRMATTPIDAVKGLLNDAGEGASRFDFAEHDIKRRAYIKQTGYSYVVFTAPGDALQKFNQSECSARFLDSVMTPVTIVVATEKRGT